MTGYTILQTETVDFVGHRSVYSIAEMDLLRGLPSREVGAIHFLKATFGGELLAPDDPSFYWTGTPTEHEKKARPRAA